MCKTTNSHLPFPEVDFYPSLITDVIDRFQEDTDVVLGRKEYPEVENKDQNEQAQGKP